MHVMDYMDAATTGILSPHVLPLEDLQEMLVHIEAELPSTMHLPVSLDDTLHFYRYLHTHILVVEESISTYPGLCTTTQDLPSIQPTHTMGKSISTV